MFPLSTFCSVTGTGLVEVLMTPGTDGFFSSFESAIADTPVYNVAVQVTGRDFYVFELEATPGRSEVEVDAPPA